MSTEPSLWISRATIGDTPTVIAGRADRALAVGADDIRDVIGDWGTWRPRIEELLDSGTETLSLDGLAWLPPVMPDKLICIGTNYSDHIAEMERAGAPPNQANPWPFGFLKPPTTSLVGHDATVRIPAHAEKIDWEAELAVVIGDASRAAEDPLSAVFGYSILNDLSARDFFPFPHVLGLDAIIGKGWDGAAPMGPWIVPVDLVGDPQDIAIELRINDVVKQDSSTAKMIFSVAEIVAHYAKVLTLAPGDVIATGTPAGVGAARKPPEFLAAGDVVDVTIGALGTLRTVMA